MFRHREGVSFYIFAKLREKYLRLEDSAISAVRESVSAGSLRAFRRLVSAALSGCFIAVLADEERYPAFASGSVFVKTLGSALGSFEMSFLKSYALSYTRSLINIVDSKIRYVDWESASRESWFAGKIVHVRE